MINYGQEMIRISVKGIEYSTNSGRTWMLRYNGTSYGTFIDLLPYAPVRDKIRTMRVV